MVNLKYFQCISCTSVIGCRTQIGHGKEQVYIFPCPNCGVNLGYAIMIDQKNLSLKYDDLDNLEYYTGDGNTPHWLTFSSDFLVEKELANTPPQTPFMSNLTLVADRSEYLLLRKQRRQAAENLWPSLERANIHRIRGNFSRFDTELRSIGADKYLDTFDTASMPQIIVEGFEKFEALFSSNYGSARKLVNDRIKKAAEVDPQSVNDLKSFYAVAYRANHLFDEMRALDRQWVYLYPFFEPLEIIDCLKDPHYPISDRYTLSEKPLERLKTFYSDCFETLGRIFVIAACYEGICAGNGAAVPSRRRPIPPCKFELMANGSKPDLISGMPFWPIFDGVFDSTLRNGIGHHSWRYDSSSDTIHYHNHSRNRGHEDFTIAYLDFCIHTRKLYHCVTVAAKYLHSVWV